MGRVVGVTGRARLGGRKFGADGFTEDHGPRCTQARHHSGITHRVAPLVNGAAVFGGEVHGVDDVLDRHRNAVQRARQMASRAVALQVVGLQRHHPVIAVREGMDVGIGRVHKLAQFDGEFLHRLLAAEQMLADLQGRELRNVEGTGAHHCCLKKSGLTTDSSLGSRSISTAWLKNWSGK
mgnify:CR=1 FL=1